METIEHRDRAGRVWRFGINCTPTQSETICRALAAVRNMGAAHPLSITGIMDAEINGPLYGDVENALLQGLAARFPGPGKPAPRVVRFVPPQENAAPVEADAPGYWWDEL